MEVWWGLPSLEACCAAVVFSYPLVQYRYQLHEDQISGIFIELEDTHLRRDNLEPFTSYEVFLQYFNMYTLLFGNNLDINILLWLDGVMTEGTTVGFETAEYITTEHKGSVLICAILYPTDTPGANFTLTFVLLEGSALFSDFDLECGITLQFKEEDRRQCHNIAIREDEICEYDSESFQVRLILTSVTDDVRINNEYETAIIVIDDVPEPECSSIITCPELLFVAETEGIITITCSRSSALSLQSVVNVTSEDGTALDSTDYSPVNLELIFRGEPFQDTVAIFNITIVMDDIDEPEEEFYLNVIPNDNDVVLRPMITVRIVDDLIPFSAGSSLSGSIIAGIAVSAVIAILLILAIIIVATIFIYVRKARKHRQTDLTVAWRTRMNNDSTSGDIYIGPEPRSSLDQLHALIPHNMIYSADQIRLSNTIGHGEMGLVYKAYLTTREGTEIVAIKMSRALLSKVDEKKMMKELSTMLSFDHPNVMTLIGACFNRDNPLIIMPFMSNGNVLEHVKQHREELLLPEGALETQVVSARRLLLGVCHQIAKGMEYLAKNMFVHRDLAARNCMIDPHGVIKVADFGLTEDMYGTKYYRRNSEARNDEKVPIRWMAPESLERDIYTQSTDVWSFGVTCWEVFTCGRVPYSGIPALSLLTALRNGERLDPPNNTACSDEINNAIQDCWEADPKDRPRFAHLVKQFCSFLEKDAGYLVLSATTPIQLPSEKAECGEGAAESVEEA